MLKTRIDQDTLHQTSGARLEQVRDTKKECERTRKALPKYLQGHLFLFQARRVERHLKACPVCTSELYSLRFAADTKQLLKDITPSEGMAARLEATFLFFGKLRLLLYRPLWILLLALVAGYLYFFVHRSVPSRPGTGEHRAVASRCRCFRSGDVPARSEPCPGSGSNPASNTGPGGESALAPVPSVKPLEITITPDDQSSMRRINDIMKGHAGLRKLRFTDTVREVSGSLTSGELQTLFSRIEQAGRVSYSRKRFSALSTTELIPFVMKLKDAPPAPAAAAEKPAPQEPAATSPTPSAQP